MRNRDLVTLTKWVFVLVASLALENAFAALYTVIAVDHVAAIRDEMQRPYGWSTVWDVTLHFPEEFFAFLLLIYFILNTARYLISSFWEFIPIADRKEMDAPLGSWPTIQFGMFSIMQLLIIYWLGGALSNRFLYFYLLALLYAADLT